MKRAYAWTGLILLLLLTALVALTYFRRDVTNAELKEDISASKTEVLKKGDEILAKLDAMALQQQANSCKLDGLIAAQRQALEKLDRSADKLDANAAKLDRLLKYADRELPDGMKMAE